MNTKEEPKQDETEYLLSIKTNKNRLLEDVKQEQDKKMYSEEDLREAFTQGMENMDYCEMYGWSSKLTEQQWFEQFKKK